MQIQNPFELIIDRLNVIQARVGDIDTIVRSGNIPPLRKQDKKKKTKASTEKKEKEVANG